MLKTIECLFSDIDNAENTIKVINTKGIKCIRTNLTNKTLDYDTLVSVPEGTYGSVSHNAISVLQSESENVITPELGILLATGPYAGLQNSTNPNNISFVTDLNNGKEEYVSLKITTDSKNLPELRAILKKHGGKKVTVLR